MDDTDIRPPVRRVCGRCVVEFYNELHPHQALTNRPPMAVSRDAIAGAGAVDMVDNVSALPTCPQPQKQTQPLAA